MNHILIAEDTAEVSQRDDVVSFVDTLLKRHRVLLLGLVKYFNDSLSLQDLKFKKRRQSTCLGGMFSSNFASYYFYILIVLLLKTGDVHHAILA